MRRCSAKEGDAWLRERGLIEWVGASQRLLLLGAELELIVKVLNEGNRLINIRGLDEHLAKRNHINIYESQY